MSLSKEREECCVNTLSLKYRVKTFKNVKYKTPSAKGGKTSRIFQN